MISETRLRVRYAETDKMGVVYHSNYLIWFEVGRVEFVRQLGLVYKNLELEEDCHIAVVDVRCKYKAPARYDDCILVRTRLRNVRESVIHFEYEVLRETDQVMLAIGDTTHVVVSAQMTKRTLPEKYLKAFRAAVE